MAPRLLIAEFKHETNAFADRPTGLEAYRARYLMRNSEKMLPFFRGVATELGGFIDICEAEGVELLPVVAANAMPGGKVTGEAYAYVRNLIYTAARENSVDGILLSLHGAMVTEESADGEGDLLEGLRAIVGPDLPIICTLDLHGNITQKMATHATALIGYKSNPHVDSFDRAQEAARLMLRVLRGEVKPVMKLRGIPLLCPSLSTSKEPAAGFQKRLRECEAKPGVLSATLFYGFFRSDIPEAAMSALAVTDNDPDLAQAIVDDFARRIMKDRRRFVKSMQTPEQAIAHARAAKEGPIVLADISDNPGGGAAGDSTHLLAALLKMNAGNAAVAIIVDPETVDQAVKAGPGAQIRVRLGGKSESVSGAAIEAEATVRTLSDGKFHNKGPMRTGLAIEAGLTAVLNINDIEVVACSTRFQPMDPEIFRRNGIEPLDKKILVVKSAQHYRAAYETLAKEIIEVDAPGMASQHPAHFPFTRRAKPAFPLEDLAEWD